MKRYCRLCEVTLRLSELRCPYCRKSAVGWLHVTGAAVLGVTTAVYLLRIF